MDTNLNELFDMLSTDRDDVKSAKKIFEDQLNSAMNSVRSADVQNVDISREYNLDTEFDKFKSDDIILRNKVNYDSLEYKIALFQDYLQELFQEKKFNEYRRDKEQALSNDEYKSYIKDVEYKNNLVLSWYQEFMTK